MPPVGTEYQDLVRYAIISGDKCLTWSSTNVQLGVAVDVHASAMGIAWNDATTQVPGFDLNRLTQSVVRLCHYLIVPGGNEST